MLIVATELNPHTPQSAVAASRVYGRIYSEAPEAPEAPEPTPRTKSATANLMNKFVDRLLASSKDILSHFAISVQGRDEAWVHELRAHKDAFNQYYKIYTMEAAPFIDIDVVSEKTRSHDNEALWQQMTQTVAIANLANLLSDVEDLHNDQSYVFERTSAIQRIEENFPLVFIPGGREALERQNWLIDEATAEQAFAIRAQRYIETLRDNPQVSQLRLLARIFFDIDCDKMTDDMVEGNIGQAGFRPFFVGFDINTGDQWQQYRDRISGFRDMLMRMQPDAVIASLEDDRGEYSFDRFLAGLKDWIRTTESNIPGAHHSIVSLSYTNRDSPYSPGQQLQAESSAPR